MKLDFLSFPPLISQQSLLLGLARVLTAFKRFLNNRLLEERGGTSMLEYCSVGARKMAQWLRTPTALSEDKSLTPAPIVTHDS